MDGLAFAREIGTPLTAHLSIHWGGTSTADDPDGKLLAKFREGLDKWLQRQEIPGGLTAIWIRERQRNKRAHSRSEVTHAHVLLHLPDRYKRNGPWREALMRTVERLVDRQGEGNLHDRTFPENPDGKYFLKGATPAAWREWHVPERWQSRRGEGVIEGKRCGTTENIGPAARRRWREATRATSS